MLVAGAAGGLGGLVVLVGGLAVGVGVWGIEDYGAKSADSSTGDFLRTIGDAAGAALIVGAKYADFDPITGSDLVLGPTTAAQGTGKTGDHDLGIGPAFEPDADFANVGLAAAAGSPMIWSRAVVDDDQGSLVGSCESIYAALGIHV